MDYLRLKEEIKRLNIKQKDLCILGNVSSSSLQRYVQGDREISSRFLTKIAPLGFDVQYIITGIKSNSAPLAPQLKELTELFEQANDSIKLAVMATLKAGHAEKVKTNNIKNVKAGRDMNININ